MRPPAQPEQVAGGVHERRRTGLQLGPSRWPFAQSQFLDWGGGWGDPRSVAIDASSARTRSSHPGGWRGRHTPTSTGPPLRSCR